MIEAPVKHEFLGFGKITVPKNTALKMREIIKKASINEYVRKWAERIVEDVEDRDEVGEAEVIFNFVQTNTRYGHDPRGTEYIQTPHYILKQIEVGMKPTNDCDDSTTLSLSLLRSLGFKTKIRVTGYRSDGRFSHVYGLVVINGKWVPYDCVNKKFKVGWQAPNPKRIMDILV